MNDKQVGLVILAAASIALFIFFAAGTVIFISSFLIQKGSNGNSNGYYPTPQSTRNNSNSHVPTPESTQISNGNKATPSPTQISNLTPTPTPTEENLADRIRREMNTGNIVYDAPIEMNLDDTKTVDMILGPNKTVAELENQITEKEGKLIQSEKIQWYGYMEADLQGTDFEITPLTPSKQLVSREDITKWSWTIKPKKPGKQTLNLTLYALIDENGSERPLVIRPFGPKVITVDVTFFQRLGIFLNAAGTHMGWILTLLISIIFPFAVWLYKWIKKKKRKPAAARRTARNKKTVKPKAEKPEESSNTKDAS